MLFVPCQGGIWPYAGTVRDAGALVPSAEIRHAENRTAPWGFAVCNFTATYLPRYSQPSSTPVQLTIMVAPDHSGLSVLRVDYDAAGGPERFVQIVITSTRSAVVQVNDSGVLREVCRLTPSQMSGATVVSVVFKSSGTSMRNDTGATASGGAAVMSGATKSIFTYGDANARVAGLQVNHPTETYMEHRPSRFVPSAVIGTDYVGHLGTLGASKAVGDTTAAELINEISEATLSAMWIDEAGVLRWESSVALRLQYSMQTVTTLDDITSLGWEDSLLGSRSKVTVRWKDVSLSTGRYQNVLVYEGAAQTLGSNERLEEIITPPDNEAWVMVDDDATRLGAYNWPPYNTKKGSFVGVDYVLDGNSVPPTGHPFVAIELTKIGPDAWKIIHNVEGSFSVGVEATTSTSATNTDLYSHNRNKGLPRVSAGAKAMWTEQEVTPTGTSGVGPELVHEGGFWVQGEIASRLATYLQAETSSPRPVITDLGVVYDPRRQLGDKITISSPNLMGVTLQALVTGISNGAGSGGFEQSLTVVITDAVSTFQTYEQFNTAGGDMTYAQWQALGTVPQNYAEFNTSEGA